MGGHSDDIMALAYHQPSLVVSCSCDGQIIAYAVRRNARAISVQMWRRKPQSRRRCGCGACPLPAQMWQGHAQSRRRCGCGCTAGGLRGCSGL